jgi:hypothetical protein
MRRISMGWWGALALGFAALGGCGDPTYYPQPGLPAYGEGGEWQSCSGQVAGDAAGSSELVVENTLTEPVDLILVDTACEEQLVAVVESGQTYRESTTHGLVFAIRSQTNGFIYAHFMWLGQYSAVEVP